MSYTVARIPQGARIGLDDPLWRKAEIAVIARYPWDENGFRPQAQARCLWNEQGLHLLLSAQEPTPRATVTEICGPVCQDSCLECFFQPYPDTDPRYVNLEVNPLGTLYCAVRFDRARSTRYPLLPEGLVVETETLPQGWRARLLVPMDFLAQTYGQSPLTSGAKLRGNFYKCGDKTPMPHYGTWAPVKAEKPDFHRPECFGEWRLA